MTVKNELVFGLPDSTNCSIDVNLDRRIYSYCMLVISGIKSINTSRHDYDSAMELKFWFCNDRENLVKSITFSNLFGY